MLTDKGGGMIRAVKRTASPKGQRTIEQAGFLMLPHPLINFEIRRFYQN